MGDVGKKEEKESRLEKIKEGIKEVLYGKIKEGREEENKPISIVLIVLIGLMILCVIWFAPEIILIMAGKKYEAAIYVVAPVAMSLLLLFYLYKALHAEFFL